MFTEYQQDQIKACSSNITELDRLTNELRLSHPEQFHAMGIANYVDGAVPSDKAEGMWERKFFDQPIRTDCYLSYVRKYERPNKTIDIVRAHVCVGCDLAIDE